MTTRTPDQPVAPGQPKRRSGRPTAEDAPDIRRRNAEWLALVDARAENFSSLARKTGHSRSAIQEAVAREKRLQAEETAEALPWWERPDDDSSSARLLTTAEKAYIRRHYAGTQDGAVAEFLDRIDRMEAAPPAKRIRFQPVADLDELYARCVGIDQLTPLEEIIRDEEDDP